MGARRLVQDRCATTTATSTAAIGPFGITVAANGDPWYTMMASNKIAKLQLR